MLFHESDENSDPTCTTASTTSRFTITVVLVEDDAPTLWRLLKGGFAAVSAAILIGGLLTNPRKKFMVYLLAALFVISLALQTVSLPGPLYRLYLTGLSLLGIPLFLTLASRNIKAKKGKRDGFTLALRLGALALGVSLAAQAGVYGSTKARSSSNPLAYLSRKPWS